MSRKTGRAVGLFAVSFLLWSTAATAQSFFLTPPCAPGLCGASRLGTTTRKAPNAALENQFVEVDVTATALLQSSSEHVAVSTFASGQPSGASGAFTADASNGGIGLALGRLDRAYHPTCPADPFDSKVEFAIETFGWRDIYASRILNCVSFDKSALTGTGTLRLSLTVWCIGTTCNASASVQSLSTYAVLGSVSSNNIMLANPNTSRHIWYAVTNFAPEPYTHGAQFQVRAEGYWPSPSSSVTH